jgi:hypothetical protein
MAITSNEFEGLARSARGKKKSSPPTVKAPQMNKKAKQRLVPWNQSPQKRTGITSL